MTFSLIIKTKTGGGLGGWVVTSAISSPLDLPLCKQTKTEKKKQQTNKQNLKNIHNETF